MYSYLYKIPVSVYTYDTYTDTSHTCDKPIQTPPHGQLSSETFMYIRLNNKPNLNEK